MRATGKLLALLCALLVFSCLSATVALAADETAPVLESTSPANGATGVLVSSPIKLTFSEPVQPLNEFDTRWWYGSANPVSVQIGGVYQYIDADFTESTVTLTPSYDGSWGSADGSKVVVTVRANGIQDLSGNLTTDTYTFSFNLKDQIVPTVTSCSPGNNAWDISPATAAVITFSEPVKAGAAELWSAITVKRNGSTIVPITKTISDNTLTLKPQSGSWDAQTGDQYTVTLPARAVVDMSGLALQNETLFSFHTVDIYEPVLLSTSPANGAKGVLVSSPITLTFSEPVRPLNEWTTWWYSDGPVIVQVDGAYEAVDASFDGNTVTLTPSSYTGVWGEADGTKVVVTAKANGLQDLSGNLTTDTYTFSFYLKDQIVPSVSSCSPLDKAWDVSPSAPVKVTFSEAVLAGANYSGIGVTNSLGQNIKITKAINGNVLTLAPASGAWDDSRGYTYSVTIPAKAVKDAAGNGIQTVYQTTFDTVDNKPPKLLAIIPANGATNVSLDAPLVLVFDEVIQTDDNQKHYSLTSSNPSKDQFNYYNWTSYENMLYIYPYDSYVWNKGYSTTYTISISGYEISDFFAQYYPSKITTKFTTIGLLSKKPGSPKAVSSSYSSAKITWTAIPGTTKYEVWRSTSRTGTYTRVGETAATSFTNTGLTTNKTYYYKVRAYQAVEGKKYYSAWSDIVSAKPVPATPSSVKAASAAYNSVKVTWAAVAGATKYEVYRATSSTGTYTKLTETTSTGYTSAGLTTGKVYYYKVRAYRLMGSTKVYGSYSAVVSSKPVPVVPAGVKAARVSASSVKVSWNAVAGAMGYEVYRSTSSGGAYTLAKSTTSLSWTNPGLTTGKTYYFKVRAYRTVGTTKVYGGYSAVVFAKP